jgi:anthranilate phosphoribosyltransferase
MPNPELRQFLSRLVRQEDLNAVESAQLLAELLNEQSTDAQIAATLVALSAKGETVDELAGLAGALRERAVRIACNHPQFIDTAGTGSSAAKTFNISTAAAFVIAGAGLPVAKHGNRAASSRAGSADVLTELGVNISAAPAVSQECLSSIGICFMFAPLYHGATARVAAVRRELGVNTTFNLLGPLSNPARAPRQIIGVWRRDLVEVLAHVLAKLGTQKSWVVHGEDGLDEITLSGKTFVAEADSDGVRTFTIQPEQFGFRPSSMDALRGGDAADNARIIREVLIGKRKDEARALVIMNAAAALVVGGVSKDLKEAANRAAMSIDSGSAERKLTDLVKATN